MSGWISAIGTILLGIVGLWAANSYRLRVRSALTQSTTTAYGRLWETMGEPDSLSALNPDQRQDLAKRLRRWYFTHGDGLLMPRKTSRLFFKVMNNLTADATTVEPKGFRETIKEKSPDDPEIMLVCLAKRQLSLLRTQLKTDLTLHSMAPTFSALKPDELQLLADCGIRPRTLSQALVSVLRKSDRLRPPGNPRAAPWCLCGKCPTNSRATG